LTLSLNHWSGWNKISPLNWEGLSRFLMFLSYLFVSSGSGSSSGSGWLFVCFGSGFGSSSSFVSVDLLWLIIICLFFYGRFISELFHLDLGKLFTSFGDSRWFLSLLELISQDLERWFFFLPSSPWDWLQGFVRSSSSLIPQMIIWFLSGLGVLLFSYADWICLIRWAFWLSRWLGFSGSAPRLLHGLWLLLW